MAEAMRAAAELSPQRCRELARERFPLEPMLARYLEVYQRLAGSRSDPKAGVA
jgi:hypothetical protein